MAGKQNNQEQNEEEQLGMDQEDKLEKATKQGFAMGMGFFKGKAKGVAQVATKKLIATISAAVAPFAFTIMIVLMVVIMIATLLDMLGMNIFTNEDNSSSIGNSSLMQMFEINENGIAMKNPDEFMQNFKKRLEENGMNIRSLGLGNEEQTKKYLLRFYRASMATQIPYIATSEVKGIMRIKRTSTTVEEARELTWVTHERFTQMLEAKDTSIQNYYALDENWNLCVSTMVENRAEGTITQTLNEIKIPYQSLVSQYSVPFRYLMTMLQITRNPQYIDYMCSMFVEGKQIDFTIFDSIQTTTNTTTYSHSIMKKWIEEPEEDDDDDDFDDYDDDYDDEEEGELLEDGPIEQPDEVTTTVTITNTITANVTYANTWLVELKNDYTNQSSTEYPLGEGGQVEELEDEEEPDDPEDSDDGVITWDVERSNTHMSEVVKNTWEQAGTNGQIKESEFLGLWKNATGTPQVGAPYDPSGIEVQYNLPETIHPKSPLPNILTAEEFLFELLERYEDTQSYCDIMKYMLYIYTGKDYGVTSLDIDIFKADDFQIFSSSVVGGSFEEKVWFGMRAAGYSEIAVAGAMGSFYQESNFMSNCLENKGNKALGISDEEYTARVNNGSYTREQFCKDKHGYGLAQWTWHTRKAGLYDYAKQKNVGIEDETMQVEYLLQELAGKYPNWENATTVETAAEIFCREFENPDMSVANLSGRIAKAKEYYEKYKGKTAADFAGGGNFEGGSTIGVRCPRYFQSGQSWSSYPYNYDAGKTIASGGCGACALAMGVSGLTGMEVTPLEIVQYLNSIGTNTVYNGSGSAQKVAAKYGLSYEFINRSNKAKIDAALDQGKVLIFSIKANGIYTGDGHFIMCVGRQGDKYYVLESGHYYDTDRPYAFNQVFTYGSQGIFALGR